MPNVATQNPSSGIRSGFAISTAPALTSTFLESHTDIKGSKDLPDALDAVSITKELGMEEHLVVSDDGPPIVVRSVHLADANLGRTMLETYEEKKLLSAWRANRRPRARILHGLLAGQPALKAALMECSVPN